MGAHRKRSTKSCLSRPKHGSPVSDRCGSLAKTLHGHTAATQPKPHSLSRTPSRPATPETSATAPDIREIIRASPGAASHGVHRRRRPWAAPRLLRVPTHRGRGGACIPAGWHGIIPSYQSPIRCSLRSGDDGQPWRSLPPLLASQHSAGVNALALSADEQRLWTGSRDSIITW